MSIKKLRPRKRDYDISEDYELSVAKLGNVNAVIEQANTIIDEINTELAKLEESIIQYDKAPFITTWDTRITGGTGGTAASAENQIKLPLVADGTYNFNVDWGDGRIDNITSYDQAERTHTYRTPGVYTIKITGLIKGFSFQYNDDSFAGGDDHNKLTQINQWGCLILNSPSVNWAYFQGCYSLTIVDAPDIPDLSQTTSLGAMFETCPNLTEITNIANWDVSNITTLGYMFENQWQANYSLNPDIGSWDVSNVTSFAGMFNNMKAFNRDLGAWDMSSAKSIAFMFSGSGFNNGGSPSINNWNLSNNVSLNSTFRSTPFNQPIGNWDVSKVTDLRGTFRSCSFNQDISGWQLDSWTNAPDTFLSCPFNYDISSWNFSKLTWASRFLNSGAFSTANYNALLLALAAAPELKRGVFISTGPRYTTDGTGNIETDPAAARAYIISTWGWSISDQGLLT